MKNKLIILMYHSIGSSDSSEVGAGIYSVPLKNFEQQMDCFAKVARKLGTVPCGDSPCITFDDGDVTNYKHAFPILQVLGLKAYFFILVAKIGELRYMDWQQIRELKNAGMIIGSHGMTHRILTELNSEELEYELKESKKILEEKLKDAIEYFSIPRGFYNKKVIEKAKEIGYKAIFTSDVRDNDGFKFGRIPVKANWSLGGFIRIMNDGFTFKEKAEELLKNYSKKIIGAKNYDRLRMRILR